MREDLPRQRSSLPDTGSHGSFQCSSRDPLTTEEVADEGTDSPSHQGLRRTARGHRGDRRRRRPLSGGDDLARERQRDDRPGGHLRGRVPRLDADPVGLRKRRLDRRGAQAGRGPGVSVAEDVDSTLLDQALRIATEVAAPNADDVDREARFPIETLSALREARLLSVLVPTDLGGPGASLAAVAAACFELGRRCGASAMVFAMHQIQVACLVDHRGDGAPWFDDYLRELVAEQRLIASITSEVGTGGDMGRSVGAASEAGTDGYASFEKQAPTVSYGGYADAFLTTVRRAPDAEGGDQVAVLTRREQMEMEVQGTWDPLGMRGTCSPGFIAPARLTPDQVLPVAFSTISAETMTPVSHVFWSHVWLGIATDAFDRARAFVKAAAKRKPGERLPAAIRLAGRIG